MRVKGTAKAVMPVASLIGRLWITGPSTMTVQCSQRALRSLPLLLERGGLSLYGGSGEALHRRRKVPELPQRTCNMEEVFD